MVNGFVVSLKPITLINVPKPIGYCTKAITTNYCVKYVTSFRLLYIHTFGIASVPVWVVKLADKSL